MIDSEKIKKALDAMDNADLQKEYNPIKLWVYIICHSMSTSYFSAKVKERR